MYDLVVRGGTIVDGTGAAPFVGDVAIQGGVIVGSRDSDSPSPQITTQCSRRCSRS